MLVSTVGTVMALAGIGLAAFFYLGDDGLVTVLDAAAVGPLYWLSYGKLFFDQIYYALVVWPLEMLARLSDWFDRKVIDGLVNLVGRVPPWVAAGLRPLQSGLVQFYALAMVWGVLVLVLTLLIWPALAPLSSDGADLDSSTLLLITILLPAAGRPVRLCPGERGACRRAAVGA